MFQKIRQVIQRRRTAYRVLFLLKDGNLTVAGKGVLSDLRSFCRATSTPAVVSQQSGVIDPIATGIAIGRLEVWHRIVQHLHVSDADLYKLVEENDEGTE